MKNLAFVVLFFSALFASSLRAQVLSPFPSDTRAPDVVATAERSNPDQVLETTWSSADGLTHTVRTTIPVEATEEVQRDRLERHARMVNLLRGLFPVAQSGN